MSYKSKTFHNVIQDFIYESMSPAEKRDYEKVEAEALYINSDQSITFTGAVSASDTSNDTINQILDEALAEDAIDNGDKKDITLDDAQDTSSVAPTEPDIELTKDDADVQGPEVDTAQSTVDASPDQTKAPAKPKKGK